MADPSGRPDHAFPEAQREGLYRAIFERRDVVIATKFFNPMGPGPNDSGHSRVHIMNAIEDSLRRLQTALASPAVSHALEADSFSRIVLLSSASRCGASGLGLSPLCHGAGPGPPVPPGHRELSISCPGGGDPCPSRPG